MHDANIERIQRRTVMISSRQIVDLIKKECNKETNAVIVAAYKKLIDRIEVLEDMDMNRDYNQRFIPAERLESMPPMTKDEAMLELNRLFGSK